MKFFVVRLLMNRPDPATGRRASAEEVLGEALREAPIFEELVFRGLLLRALLARMGPNWAIAVSALTFGSVHFLGGNALGTLAVLPALVGIGAISGVLAVRSGELSQSILLHMGFNLLAVAGALLS